MRQTPEHTRVKKVVDGDSTFAVVTGLSFSSLTEFADIDGDGLNNPNDACPLLPGLVDLQGCLPFGEVVSINKSEKHGMIERTDDGTNDLYQLRVPQDLAIPEDIPSVGDVVAFTPIVENARLATNIVEFPVNNPPSIGSVTITPAEPTINDTITCNANDVTDLDGHTLAFTYSWFREDGTLFTTGNPLAPSFSNLGIIFCEVTAFDGIDTSVPIQSDPVNVVFGGGPF